MGLTTLGYHLGAVLHTVDNQSSYTYNQLVSALSTIMESYKPAEIHTQSTRSSATFPDHNDHRAVGRFAKLAFDQYSKHSTTIFKSYLGYSARDNKPNVSQSDFDDKLSTFLEYSQYDSAVCHSQIECGRSDTYRGYLSRQYSY